MRSSAHLARLAMSVERETIGGGHQLAACVELTYDDIMTMRTIVNELIQAMNAADDDRILGFFALAAHVERGNTDLLLELTCATLICDEPMFDDRFSVFGGGYCAMLCATFRNERQGERHALFTMVFEDYEWRVYRVRRLNVDLHDAFKNMPSA